MAIVIEAEKKSLPWLTIFTWLIVVGVLFGGVYSLFFASTPLIEVIRPVFLKDISDLAQIQADPQKLMDNPEFGLLREYVELPQTAAEKIGKSNPFLP